MAVQYVDEEIDPELTEVLDDKVIDEEHTYVPQSRMEALILELIDKLRG